MRFLKGDAVNTLISNQRLKSR